MVQFAGSPRAARLIFAILENHRVDWPTSLIRVYTKHRQCNNVFYMQQCDWAASFVDTLLLPADQPDERRTEYEIEDNGRDHSDS